MYKVLFVCHGNICRSPACEYIFKYLIAKNGLENKVFTSSKATSYEEIGNDIYPPMKRTLANHGVKYSRHYASKMTFKDYEENDIIFVMDHNNMRNISYIVPNDKENKIFLLRNYVGLCGIIDDPWYTDRFEECYQSIKEALEILILKIKKEVNK